MRLLLDTHALLWWMQDDPRLSAQVIDKIEGSTVFVSVASLWEIVLKVRTGKLQAEISAIEQALVDDGFERLQITSDHLRILRSLPMHHRDPFDHLLIAQAIGENAALVSDDLAIGAYPVPVVRCRA